MNIEAEIKRRFLKALREARDAEIMAMWNAERARGYLLCPIGNHGVHVWSDLSHTCTACGTTKEQIAKLSPSRNPTPSTKAESYDRE